jgi:hypothetical protein
MHVAVNLFGWSLPRLKNIYRTVAVFLCNLNGCPDNMIRFAITLVVSGLRNVPIATRYGATGKMALQKILSAYGDGLPCGFSVSLKSRHGCFPNTTGP